MVRQKKGGNTKMPENKEPEKKEPEKKEKKEELPEWAKKMQEQINSLTQTNPGEGGTQQIPSPPPPKQPEQKAPEIETPLPQPENKEPEPEPSKSVLQKIADYLL